MIRFSKTLLVLLAATGAIVAPRCVKANDLARGEAVYRAQCAVCHGADGQGTPDKFNEPLAGDLSISELAIVIDQTMPEGEPERCSAEESAAVAAYIHAKFYSEVARERLRPARIELARLTNAQFRNAVTDLFGHFTAPRSLPKSHGLRGEYYDARNFRKEKRVIERTDPTIDFDFGVGKPDEENFREENIAARWEGSVIAPETGEYEFIVDTENATRLWVNNDRVALIDAWVRSGDERLFRGSTFLLAGRAYPIRLEYLKFGEKTASVRLKWKPPRDLEQVIPARYLRPGRSAESIVVATQFPPDDSSAGYARGNAISKEWDQATTDAALAVADLLVKRVDELAAVKADAPDRSAKLRNFAERLLTTAWAKPSTDPQHAALLERFFTESESPEIAVKKACLLALKSPSFLIREIGQVGSTDFATATRLSYGMWDSLPDATLTQAAEAGKLHEEGQVEAQAERMLRDPRTQAKVREFMWHWLKLDSDLELTKDEQALPEFTPQVVSDLKVSLDLFLDEVIWQSDRSDFRELLRADYLWLNSRLAEIYNVDYARAQGDKLSAGEFVKVPCGTDRAGVLTHPYLMATFAYHNSTSPIHRGVFLARNVLGRAIKAPPEAITPIAPELHASLSTRQRVELQTSPASCQACHAMLNPLGFTLETYDVIGRRRTEEKGQPINALGAYRDRQGKLSTFDGSRELANFLVDSPEVQAAFVQQLFYHLVKQPPAAFGPQTLPGLRERFAQNQFNIKKLIVDIMRVSALRGVPFNVEE